MWCRCALDAHVCIHNTLTQMYMCAQQPMQAEALKQNSYEKGMNVAANNGCLEQIAGMLKETGVGGWRG